MLSGCANYFWSLLNFRRTFAARITLIMSLRICFLTFLTAQGAPSSLTLICFDVDMIFRSYFVFNIAEPVFFSALFFDFTLFVHFGHGVVLLVFHGPRGFLAPAMSRVIAGSEPQIQRHLQSLGWRCFLEDI